MAVTVRPAEPDDLASLRGLERAAGDRFRGVGLDHVADDEPLTVAELTAYADEGRAWVADVGGSVAGYLLVEVLDGCGHVEQVTVHPDHQGRGIGRQLMDRAASWAAATGRSAVTLTTFASVPWNRPLYEHLGYRVLLEHEIGPELRRRREVEAEHGLDPAIRVCMRLELPR